MEILVAQVTIDMVELEGSFTLEHLKGKGFIQIITSCSDLNQHKFTIGLVESPQCDCFLYLPERQVMFGTFDKFIENKWIS